MPSKIGYGYKIKTWLEKFFDLKEDIQPMNPPVLSEVTVPILDIGWYLGHWMYNSLTISVTGTGWVQAFVAESTHRYKISHLISSLITGTWTFTMIAVYDASLASQVTLDNFSATTSRKYPRDEQIMPIWLEPNDKIYLYVDAHTATGNLKTELWSKVWKTYKERDPWRDL